MLLLRLLFVDVCLHVSLCEFSRGELLRRATRALGEVWAQPDVGDGDRNQKEENNKRDDNPVVDLLH